MASTGSIIALSYYDLYRSSRNGTRPYGPSDSGRTCVLPVGTDRPARRRPAAVTARLHRADSLPSLCADEAALPKRRHNLAPMFETQTQIATLALRSHFKDTPHICLQPFRSGESCLGHRTEQDPAALHPSPWWHMGSTPPSRRLRGG